jgi:N-ethylmaleimide reductase
MRDSQAVDLFSYLIDQLNSLQLAYLHLIEPRASSAGGNDDLNEAAPNVSQLFRKLYQGAVILAGGFDRESAIEAVKHGQADAIAFGRFFISNPDLPKRLEINADLHPYDRATFYGGAAKGYTDYVTL